MLFLVAVAALATAAGASGASGNRRRPLIQAFPLADVQVRGCPEPLSMALVLGRCGLLALGAVPA